MGQSQNLGNNLIQVSIIISRPKLGHSYMLASGTWRRPKLGHSYRLASGTWRRPKLGHSYRLHCKKRGVSEHPRGVIFYCFHGNPYCYHGNSKILLPWGVQLHRVFYSVASGTWGKAKAGAQYSFSQVSFWDMARAGLGVQHSSSQILHHTAVSVRPSCKFCMSSIIIFMMLQL